MHVTVFTFILLPLSLLWCMRPMRLLQLMVVSGIFEAAAALVIGSLGLQPGLVPAVTFMGYVSLQLLLGARYAGQTRVWQLCTPFLLVVGWALVSAYLMPQLFEGKAYIWPQKALPPFVLTMLTPAATNLNQTLYLVLDAILLVLGALFLTRSRLSLRPLLNAYIFSVFLAGALAIWQLASKVGHIPFPEEVFYSNPGWAILTGQSIGSIPRLNGTFSEPSSLGSYMAAAVCCAGWMMLQGHRDTIIRVLFGAAAFGVLLSTSTTGFGVLALASAGVLAMAVLGGSSRLMGSIVKVGVPLVLALGLLILVASTLDPHLLTAANDILSISVNKTDSSSYNDRTSTDVDSLMAALDTYGLGVGFGVNRSSSLLPGLLAGVGVPGVLGLVWFGWGLTRQVRAARRMDISRDNLMVIDGCCGALSGYIIAALLSAPSITSVTFFGLLALLISCVVRVQMEARQHRAARQRPEASAPAVAAPPVAAPPAPASGSSASTFPAPTFPATALPDPVMPTAATVK